MATTEIVDSRKYIMRRRGTGISNLQAVSITTGEFTIDQAEVTGVYKMNCTHQVGIATSTEVGLSPDRYAIRIVLVPAGTKLDRTPTDAVSSHWKLVNDAAVQIRFQRKAIVSELGLINLYKYMPEIDDALWAAYEAVKGTVTEAGIPTNMAATRDSIRATLMLLNPTTEQIAALVTAVNTLITTCVAAKKYVYIPVEQNVNLMAVPHGNDYTSVSTLSANRVALLETMLCASVNAQRIKRRNETVSDGITTLAGYAIANMFRMGLHESFEHREYYTVAVTPVEGSTHQLKVIDIRTPTGCPALTDITLNQMYDLTTIRVNRTMVELGNSCVIVSGLMHYMYNHTTGGVVTMGPLLTTLAMYQFVTHDMSQQALTEITTVMYEALHGVNKRAVANLFFKTSNIHTSSRDASSPRAERYSLDSFIMIRCTPYPAGSHKAFVAMSALKRVLQAGLGPFLPWADQVTSCIAMCREVLKNGARAHIGSSYYTGEPPRAQPASIDQYMPELAQYVRVFNRGDSLSMSPHLSDEVAKRCGMNWQTLMKELKAKDVSATKIEVVREFLATAGGVHYTFDPEKQDTWGKAVADSNLALASLDAIFT